MNLLEILSQFKGSSEEKELEKCFSDLAPAFLYGGYINVNNLYRVYIKTVEFYFHSEMSNGIHDPIVYHRNGNGLGNMPYFPLMTLHAHNSGYDITFESEAGKYRASALIREYEVKCKDGKYLKWNASKRIFESKYYCFNAQSTYLYVLLNGFPLGETNNITWVDEEVWRPINLGITNKPRKNVFKYEFVDDKFIKMQPEQRCERMWSFTRKDEI
jgi:hypothetical protein